jgi:hypothetical protein
LVIFLSGTKKIGANLQSVKEFVTKNFFTKLSERSGIQYPEKADPGSGDPKKAPDVSKIRWSLIGIP